MTIIGITQRVSTVSKYGERRDALDQRWALLLQICGYTPYPIPNNIKILDAIFHFPLKGIILTGGNTWGKEAPERDEVERAILHHALKHFLPVLGVCRGMQGIIQHFGACLEKVDGHVAVSHKISLEGQKCYVNSYHEFGALTVQKPLTVIGQAEDGVIEAVKHVSLPIQGIMWHPERNYPFADYDKTLLCNFFL